MEESDRELIERLRHRATEHRNFFGSAKDYELMEEAAARLEALSVGVGREEIARIIEPYGFALRARKHRPERYEPLCDAALAKADAILALSPALVSGGGEDEGVSRTSPSAHVASATETDTSCDLEGGE